MGLYTNTSNYVSREVLDYTTVPTYFTEGNINFQELGIMAAAECRENSNAIIKAIGINELAYLESTGSSEVIYEASGIGGIFEKIKMVFRKIIEKIKKIFHTFIAKMGSIFSDARVFANKYGKEVAGKWGNVKNNWSISGYKFTLPATAGDNNYISAKAEFNKDKWIKATDGNQKLLLQFISLGEGSGNGSVIKKAINGVINEGMSSYYYTDIFNEDDISLTMAIRNAEKKKKERQEQEAQQNQQSSASDKDYKETAETLENAVATANDKKEEIQDKIRASWISSAAKLLNPDVTKVEKLDSSEFTEELFKLFRNGEDSKIDLEKKDIDITEVVQFVKDSDKIKSNIKSTYNAFVSGVDKAIKNIDKEQKEYLNNDSSKPTDSDYKKCEGSAIQLLTIAQNFLQFDKECGIQYHSALLQAIKDKVSFYKSIMVKVIGQSKKMTEESYDYSSQYSYDSGSSFMDSVQLV